MIELEEGDLNRTELRNIYASFGFRFPREFSPAQIEQAFNECELILTDQVKLRTQTEKFVQKNWDHLKVIAEVYACTGDCASPMNKCTDVRAITCFKECFPQTRRSVNG
jgi:hypothetical protein